MPEGAEIVVLSGDPSKDGQYVVRLKMPAGYKVPAHNHPTTEMVTVISGDFHLGMGDRLDEDKSMLLTAGGFCCGASADEPLRLGEQSNGRANPRSGAVRDHLRKPRG